MDLREYYRKIREIEQTIDGPCAIIASLATPDGGRAGVLSEVARNVAARMVADSKAALATSAEAARYRQERQDEAARISGERLTSRLQSALLSEAEIRRFREGLGLGKE